MAERDFIVASMADGRWFVKREGASRINCTFTTEHAAEEYGSMLARSWRSDLTVRGTDGSVRVLPYAVATERGNEPESSAQSPSS